MIEKAVSNGLLMFNLSVPPASISREIHIDLIICYRCYQWNDHKAANCKRDSSYVICSICSSTGHSFKNCESKTKKCINCNGNHCTVSYSCPKRKQIVRSITSEKHFSASSSKPSSYSNSVKMRASSKIDSDIMETTSRSIMCVLVAALKQPDTSEEFETILNELLKVNNLPPFQMGGVTPPIINLMTGSSTVKSQLVDVDGECEDEMSEYLTTSKSSGTECATVVHTKQSDLSDSHVELLPSPKNGKNKGNKNKLKGNSPASGPSYINTTGEKNGYESPVASAVKKFANLQLSAEDHVTNNRRPLRYARKNGK